MSEEKKSGLLIVLEGPDGCGKSSQARMLHAWMLVDLKLETHLMREPGSTYGGEKIRGVLLDKETGDLELDTEVCLYNAARVESSRKIVEPKLRAGTNIVSDRDYCSTLAYQGERIKHMKEIHTICRFAVGYRVPDLTIFYKPESFEESVGRMANREKDRIESKGEKFGRKVWNNYFNILPEFLRENEGREIRVVDNTNKLSMAHAQEESRKIVGDLLREKGMIR